MDWFYVIDGQQCGPVDLEELKKLAGEGIVTATTLVWNEDMADWKPYGLSTFVPRPARSPARMWRKGDLLIIELTSTDRLPDRCMKCNAPAHGFRLIRNFKVESGASSLLHLSPILMPLLLVRGLTGREADVEVPLCPRHERERRLSYLWTGALCFAGLVLFIGGFYGHEKLLVPAVIVTVAGLLYGINKTSVLSVHRIDDERIWLSGVSQDFLASATEWRE